MAEKLLVGIAGNGAAVARWRGSRIVDCREFGADEGGRAAFKVKGSCTQETGASTGASTPGIDAGWDMGPQAPLRLGSAGSRGRPPRVKSGQRLAGDRHCARTRRKRRRPGHFVNNWAPSTGRAADPARTHPSRRSRLARRIPPCRAYRRGKGRSSAPWRGRQPLYRSSPPVTLPLHALLTLPI